MEANYVWGGPYRDAILDTEGKKQPNRLREAKAAIGVRLQELQLDHGGTPEERYAISDALACLKVLQRELETRSHDTGSSSS
jgi:hypothetical protein